MSEPLHALATLLGPESPGPQARLRSVAQGQAVFQRGAPAHSLVALLQGEVALGLRTATGEFRAERLQHGPAWLDLASAWLPEPRHAMDAQAWSAATVAELPCDPLWTQLARQPAQARRLIQGLAREVQALADDTHALMHQAAPARLARWLHQRCEPARGGAHAVVRLAMRKRDIAAQLAITPETLSRLMRAFTRQGLVEVAGYTVRVLDVPALGRLAEL